MSTSAMGWVWENSEQEGANLLLMLALADEIGADGVSFPNIKRLARKSRVSEEEVESILDEIELDGEVEVSFPHGELRVEIKGVEA